MSNEQIAPTQPELFKIIRREATLSNRVTVELENLIIEGRLQPGDRLPPERDLADQFGVSRTVVREAVRALVAKGLLEVRSGSGTLVRTLTPALAAESMTLLLRLRSGELDYNKVIEVRRMLEVEIAGLAAQRHSEVDLAAIEDILDLAQRTLDDPDTYVEMDVLFHAALARATQNDLFSVILDSIADILIEVRRLSLNVPDTPRRALAYHQNIYERVKACDVAGARDAMDRHMDEAEDTMHRALARRNTSRLSELARNT